TKENGELIQVSGTIASNNGKVAGVVLYDEGFLMLTGSWNLSSTKLYLRDSTTRVNPSWLYFGVGSNDGLNQAALGADYITASYNINFKGFNETQVMTMFAHAGRGQVNYSNNPSFLQHGQNMLEYTSSRSYEQRSDIKIANTVSSSYTDYSASFKRQVYVSRIAIYDDFRNLMGVATLSKPVLKEEGQDISFKLKLDI
ncbi:MAG TPA: hypothetical protein DCM40_25230, partial [Maribacter sp.]|nr:hypothetical protein [Maribacter sp.]